MATDSIGMASVSVALDVGCEIIMIVENAEQKNLLKRTFPTIKEKYIGMKNSTILFLNKDFS